MAEHHTGGFGSRQVRQLGAQAALAKSASATSCAESTASAHACQMPSPATLLGTSSSCGSLRPKLPASSDAVDALYDRLHAPTASVRHRQAAKEVCCHVPVSRAFERTWHPSQATTTPRYVRWHAVLLPSICCVPASPSLSSRQLRHQHLATTCDSSPDNSLCDLTRLDLTRLDSDSDSTLLDCI